VRKFDAPKATLVSYILKGILDRELPWGLVIFGALLSITMELAGVPSLAFAVGVYLPISTSAPLAVGGLIRWLVDRRSHRQPENLNLDDAQFAALTDRGPGVLLASGYIAGGAIAGIVIAFLAGALGNVDAALQRWSAANNPFFEGPWSDLLALGPFALLALLLWLVGRGSVMGASAPARARKPEG
jgi:uncharacterized oligopeptide transporter (OPT) family protein